MRKISNPAPGLSLFIRDNGHQLIVASEPFSRGQILHDFYAREKMSEPTYLSVQTGANEHIHLGPEYLQYINHGCEPNVHMDVSRYKVVCLRDIAPGEEVLFFYPSTDLDMTRPFECLCGAASCLGIIRGAMHIPLEVITRYVLNDHVSKQVLPASERAPSSRARLEILL